MMFPSIVAIAAAALAADPHWIPTWTASVHGPYPAGNPVAQPVLDGILDPKTGATDQTFRLIVRPNRVGTMLRLRFSNAMGTQPLTLDGVYVGVHASAGSVVRGSNLPFTFSGGRRSVTIAPGQWLYSDPVKWRSRVDGKLAVSFHVAGSSGPMTWHAKAITTSYLTGPNAGSRGADESSDPFPFTTTSWFFLDAVETDAPCGTPVIVAFGDSITDGTGSTINGDDRWPDFLAQRLRGANAVVVNAGIGGNRVVTDAGAGGPSALHRLERDVLSLPGVTTVIWLEGINDLGTGTSTVEEITAGFREGVTRMHAKGIRVVGATMVSALKSTPTQGTPEVDAKRKAINDFIRKSGVFDGVADFDAATLDPTSGTLRREFWPNSGTGGPGDGLHPNRAGYQAMANAIDLRLLNYRGQGCKP
jgi:lysophospholipase L1-like esterase